jgi:hypothetical protein
MKKEFYLAKNGENTGKKPAKEHSNVINKDNNNIFPSSSLSGSLPYFCRSRKTGT